MIDQQITLRAQHNKELTGWGKLVWQVSAAIGNSRAMTVGVCYLNPGCHNARHCHPNCDEVLVVKSGRIIHTLGGEEREMETGDVIVVPTGVMHGARNIGDEPAELSISFSSADRQTILEDLESDVTLSAIPSNP
jgi:quercetin dioxygenase-like cupin family protein